jgi:N-acetylmuramoyl-L-alanine amidase
MNVRFVLKIVLALALVLGFSVTAFASAQNEYSRGVSAFNSLLANEKRAGLRAEWEAVMKPFLRSVAADPKSEFAPRSMFFLGRCYEELALRSFSRADRLKALETYDRMLAAYPKHGWSDDALFRMGLIWQEQFQDSARAAQMFKTLVETYPKGDKVPEARERLAKIQGSGSVKSDTTAKAQPVETKSAQPKQEAAPKKDAPAPAKLKEGLTLLGIRHWSSPDYTRVVMDVTQDVHYERTLVERAENGNKQLQITLQQAGIAADVMLSRTIQDGILSQIQVVPDPASGARVTLDLMSMDNYRVFTLPDPYRVVIDIYGAGVKAPQPEAVGVAPSPAPVPPSGGDVDHVQAALAELQAKQAAEPKKEVAVKQAAQAPTTKTPAVQPKHTAQAPAKEPTSPEVRAPELKVSSTQKKYTGSLVEQLGLKVRTIMIDPGHGGKDPGAVANGLREKDINLRMARILGAMLKEQGFEVHYTRTTDKFIPLEERTAMANARNADLFISVHCNAYKDTSAKGFEVYYLNLATDAQAVRVAARENGVSAKKISDMQFILSDLMLNSKINESRQMASMVEEETLRVMRPKYALSSHGSKGAFFYVLTGARMPSILVELGYLTNPEEAKKLNSDAYLTTMAQGLTRGVLAYKKKLERFALNESGNS